MTGTCEGELNAFGLNPRRAQTNVVENHAATTTAVNCFLASEVEVCIANVLHVIVEKTGAQTHQHLSPDTYSSNCKVF